MNSALLQLNDHDLSVIAAAIRTGRIVGPHSPLSLHRVVAPSVATDVSLALSELTSNGMSDLHIAQLIELLVADRVARVVPEDVIELVTSGPELPGETTRDTSVVVRDLFRYAKQSVWIAGYAVKRSRKLFTALAEQMKAMPGLNVTLLLDVRASEEPSISVADHVRQFAINFRKVEWPNGVCLPRAFYFPASLATDPRDRASMHAKCVVIDESLCFVTSANFTEAAQKKNIEVGVLIRSAAVARRLRRHLESFVQARVVQPLW